jgi:hypothetical protein
MEVGKLEFLLDKDFIDIYTMFFGRPVNLGAFSFPNLITPDHFYESSGMRRFVCYSS